MQFKKGVTAEIQLRVLANFPDRHRYRVPEGLYLIRSPSHRRIESVEAQLTADPSVEFVQPNYILSAQVKPNDPLFHEQWGPEDLQCPAAWDVSTGGSDIGVAVIDTGINYEHPDLEQNVWTNPGEIPGNGMDDDQNGYIDDVHGINTFSLLNSDSGGPLLAGDPKDDNGHGTAVAGIIGAYGDNAKDLCGVAWRVRLIPCKFAGLGGKGTLASVIECLSYVAKLSEKYTVVATNNSYGERYPSTPCKDALRAAIAVQRDLGILFIASAGNDGWDSDREGLFYPAGFHAANLIAVGASTQTDMPALFSDFGRRSVHMVAPGENIKVLNRTGGADPTPKNGTSFAAPHVAGVVALIEGADKTLSWHEVRNLILAGGQPQKNQLGQHTVTGRVARAFGSNGIGTLSCLDQKVTGLLRPERSVVERSLGSPLELAALNIKCSEPNGNVVIKVAGAEPFELEDNGQGFDEVAGDGIYSGLWTAPAVGDYELQLDNGDNLRLKVVMPVQGPVGGAVQQGSTSASCAAP